MKPDTVFLLKQILRMAGFNVLSAASGEEALEQAGSAKPDLVLLDLMMPDMDGWETFRNIRQKTNIPVIVVSALGSKEDVTGGLEQGVDDYIAKPFYNAEVTARVKAVLRRTQDSARGQPLCVPADRPDRRSAEPGGYLLQSKSPFVAKRICRSGGARQACPGHREL